MRSFLKLSFVFSVLRRRVLKSSAEREQLLQQLTQRGGQKKSGEQPPFGKKFLRRKISKAEKEARVVLRLERLPTCFLSWNNQFFFTDTSRYIFIKKLLSRCSFVCTATTLKLRRRIVSSSLTRVIHHQRSWWWFMYT
jgi:hypothetical protein